MSFLRVDMGSIASAMDSMEAGVERAARPAAQAMAQVYYDQVKRNVAALGRKTGNLDNSIYQAFSQKSSTPTHAVYNISWNPRKAPHGHLVEYGHLMRYRMYKGNDGQIRPMVQPGKEGTAPPSYRAAQSVKDAYYVKLPTPIQIPAKAFVRSAGSQTDAALEAGQRKLFEVMNA